MQNVCYLKKDTERLRKFYRTVNIVLLSIISLKICLSGKTHKEFCFQEKYKNNKFECSEQKRYNGKNKLLKSF